MMRLKNGNSGIGCSGIGMAIAAELLGAVLLLPLIWKVNGIWISIVVAEVMAVIFTTIFLVIKQKKYHY